MPLGLHLTAAGNNGLGESSSKVERSRSSVRRLRSRDAERSRRQQLRVDRPLAVSFDTERAGGHEVGAATLLLTGAECPFTCLFCDLWQHTILTRTPLGAIPQQIAAATDELGEWARSSAQPSPPIAVLKLYNASNFFDERAVPEADDAAVIEAVRSLPLPDDVLVVVECHPKILLSTSGRRRLEIYASELRLEVALGLESTAPGAMEALMKGATLEEFSCAFELVISAGASVRAFVLFGVPIGAGAGLEPSDQQRQWSLETLRWARDHGASCASVIPVRPGNGAMEILAANGEWQAPTLAQLEMTFKQALALERQAPRFDVHLDTWDLEAVERGCLSEGEADRTIERLRRMSSLGAEEYSGAEDVVDQQGAPCEPMS